MSQNRPNPTSTRIYELVAEREAFLGDAVTISNAELLAELPVTIRPIQRAIAELAESGRVSVEFQWDPATRTTRRVFRRLL